VTKRRLSLFLPALGVVLLDQATKWLVVRNIPLHHVIPVVDGFFDLVHVRNRGMAFGLMNRPGNEFVFYALLFGAVAAIGVLLYWFSRLNRNDDRLIAGFSLIIGGALGNLIDRIRLQGVVDFLDFYYGSYHWPAFNIADTAVTIGAFWVALNLFVRSSGNEAHGS